MAKALSVPVLSLERGLDRYLEEIKKFPMLSQEEEFSLAAQWHQESYVPAAQKLVTSHLRLVAKIAMSYRGYGLPIGEVISEGNIGLMQAVKRFDPGRGFRLATYAMWWIRASIQEYVLRTWSLVKIGTTTSQKKLFFNLRRLKSKILALEEGDLKPDHVQRIADQLNVPQQDVVEMNRRMGGDHSLNVSVHQEGEGEWQDFLADERETQENALVKREEKDTQGKLLSTALSVLNEREHQIFVARRLQDPPLTLEDLSSQYAISRERVRQIEARAFEKVRAHVHAGVKRIEAPVIDLKPVRQ